MMIWRARRADEGIYFFFVGRWRLKGVGAFLSVAGCGAFLGVHHRHRLEAGETGVAACSFADTQVVVLFLTRKPRLCFAQRRRDAKPKRLFGNNHSSLFQADSRSQFLLLRVLASWREFPFGVLV